MINLNILALIKLTRLYLPQLLETPQSRILNVASTAGFFPGPLMSVYFATKAFVISFTEALSFELVGKNPSITCICPSSTKTNFENRANAQNSVMFTSFASKADKVAKTGYIGMMKGKSLVIYGITNRILLFFGRLLPWQLQALFMSTITKEV